MQTEVKLMGRGRTHDLSKKKSFGEKRYIAERENKRTREKKALEEEDKKRRGQVGDW